MEHHHGWNLFKTQSRAAMRSNCFGRFFLAVLLWAAVVAYMIAIWYGMSNVDTFSEISVSSVDCRSSDCIRIDEGY